MVSYTPRASAITTYSHCLILKTLISLCVSSLNIKPSESSQTKFLPEFLHHIHCYFLQSSYHRESKP
ncbi:hypothetical protein BpHYR1_008341 [Brachionus plicatilis]|uniref:Uncharacterized protein n=1 Tax=Brachionus plicatilis TaxID=10195 RepID=A0A3M7SCX1_BRAPC|nr:hypothetical protein BpHYR1_008341 [Brachionus plicatilis]